MMDGGEGGQIPTNLRLLVALEAMAEAGVPVTPTEVNARLGLPKPTIHRLFATLEEEGFVQREIDGRTYSPGRRLRVLSSRVLSSLRIRTARVAILRRLSEEIGETCNIALPGRDAMIYVERVETQWPLRIQLPIGTRVPLPCTASGKVYLASLRRAHRERTLRAMRLEARTPNTLTEVDALLDELGDRSRARATRSTARSSWRAWSRSRCRSATPRAGSSRRCRSTPPRCASTPRARCATSTRCAGRRTRSPR